VSNSKIILIHIKNYGMYTQAALPLETLLSVNEELLITFFHLDLKVTVKIIDKIVRVDPEGVGVKLYDTIPDIYFNLKSA